MLLQELRNYPKDIKKLLWVSFTNGLLFFLPILALYYEENLFSITNVALVLGVGAITLSIMEVPSGAIADLFGRKKTILLSRTIIFLSLIALFIGGGFFMILLHALLRSIGRSLESGTDTAMMYDILHEKGQTSKFKKAYGTFYTIWAVGASLGSVIGGHLAEISFKVPIAATAIPVIISFFIVLSMKEPQYTKEKHHNIFKQIKHSLQTVINNKQLITLFLGIMVVYAFAESLHELNAIFFSFKEIPLFLFGYGLAATFGFSAIGHYFGHHISELLGCKKTMILASLGSAILVYTATLLPYISAMIAYTVSSIFFGVRNTVQGHLINKEISSSQRATIMSINNLTRQIGVAIALFIIGGLATTVNINTVFLIGSGGILLGAILFTGLKKDEEES